MTQSFSKSKDNIVNTLRIHHWYCWQIVDDVLLTLWRALLVVCCFTPPVCLNWHIGNPKQFVFLVMSIVIMVYVVYICFTHHRLIKPVGIKKDDTEKHSFLNIFVANNGRHAKNQDNILEKNIKFFFFLGLVCSNHLVYLYYTHCKLDWQLQEHISRTEHWRLQV